MKRLKMRSKEQKQVLLKIDFSKLSYDCLCLLSEIVYDAMILKNEATNVSHLEISLDSNNRLEARMFFAGLWHYYDRETCNWVLMIKCSACNDLIPIKEVFINYTPNDFTDDELELIRFVYEEGNIQYERNASWDDYFSYDQIFT